MMSSPFSRTELLLGHEAMERLARSRVAVFGVGGVGGHVVEALVRSGVGALDLIDNDTVCLSNLNRQLIATTGTLGRCKIDVARERCLSINPQADIRVHRTFYLPETAAQFDFSRYDYVVDAIDTVTGKIALVLQARGAGTPIISSMGAGNKLDPTAFEVADIYETSVCPLAKVMRRELKKRGVERLKVVYSREKAMTPLPAVSVEAAATTIPCAGNAAETDCSLSNSDAETVCPPTENAATTIRRATPGSVAFVPSVAGLIIAGEVVKDLTAGCRRG